MPGFEAGNRVAIVLAAVLALAGIAAIASWATTGDLGIEERFNSAIGMQGENEEESGIAIEGDVRLYLGLLGLLGAGVFLLLRRHPI
jgi:hypothetical protein